MADLVRFVDSVAATPTVRLDLNDEAVSGWYCRVFTAPAPRLRRASSANAMRNGVHVSTSQYDARVLTLELDQIKDNQDDGAVELQKLGRELDREGNLLMYQPTGATKPVFFRVFRSDIIDISDVPAQKAMRRITIELLADPFAIGLKESLGPYTVTNDPAAGSNGHFVDISGVLGDVDVPCVIRDDRLTTALAQPGGYLAVRQHGTPASGRWFYQLEASGAAATDTTNPGGGPDAAMSGTTTNNFLRTSFATDPSMVTRWTSNSTTGSVDRNGTYRVLAVVRRSDASSVIKVRSVSTCQGVITTGDTVTLPASTSRQVVDLGTFSWGDAQQEGRYGSTLVAGTIVTELQAQRVSGTGTLDWDYVMFLPADEGMTIFSRTGPGSVNEKLVLDSENEAVTTRDQSFPDQVEGSDFAAAGGFIRLRPSVTQRVFYVVSDLIVPPYKIDKTLTSPLTFEYYPRYLFVRPVAS